MLRFDCDYHYSYNHCDDYNVEEVRTMCRGPGTSMIALWFLLFVSKQCLCFTFELAYRSQTCLNNRRYAVPVQAKLACVGVGVGVGLDRQ